jgi:hypothetical protein
MINKKRMHKPDVAKELLEADPLEVGVRDERKIPKGMLNSLTDW